MEKAELESFKHRISKGSRFNQIYIPTGMNSVFEVGDVVEVRLLQKKESLFYSESLKKTKLGEFKQEIIKKIFDSLEKVRGIKQIFVVGSFLNEQEYNDIDIVIISDKNDKNIENRSYNYLMERMQMKFHIIIIPEDKFEELMSICPLSQSMMYYFVSNKKFEKKENQIKQEFNKKHLEFLLMMPEDLLSLNMKNGRIYFDSLRRLIAIKRFLDKKSLDSLEINEELKKISGKWFNYLKRNEFLNEEKIKEMKELIKGKLNLIRKELNRIR